MQVHLLTVTDDFTGCRCHGLQGFNGCFCLALLEHTQDGIQQNDNQDDDDFCPFAFAGQHASHCADGCRDQQDDQHRILQLVQETLQKGGLFAFLQLVGTILCQPRLRFGRSQTLFAYQKFTQNFFRRLGVDFLHGLNTPLLWEFFQQKILIQRPRNGVV